MVQKMIKKTILLSNRILAVIVFCLLILVTDRCFHLHYTYVLKPKIDLQKKGYYPNVDLFGKRGGYHPRWIFYQKTHGYLTDEKFLTILPYLKQLDYSWPATTIDLLLRHSQVTVKSLLAMGLFPEVSFLGISDMSITDEVAEAFRFMPNLVGMDCKNCQFTNNAIVIIFGHCPRLQCITTETKILTRPTR